MEKVIDDGPRRVSSSLDGGEAVAASASGCKLSGGTVKILSQIDLAVSGPVLF